MSSAGRTMGRITSRVVRSDIIPRLVPVRKCHNMSFPLLFLLLSLISCPAAVSGASGIGLNENGGYEDIVVSIGKEVPPIACQQLIQNIQVGSSILTSNLKTLRDHRDPRVTRIPRKLKLTWAYNRLSKWARSPRLFGSIQFIYHPNRLIYEAQPPLSPHQALCL